MAASSKKVLRMVFTNILGRDVTINVENPRDNLTGIEIEAAMEQILARNIFTSSGGDLVAKKDVKIIDTTTNDLYDPAV